MRRICYIRLRRKRVPNRPIGLGAPQSLLEQRTDLKPEYIRFVVRWGLMNMPRLSRVEVPDTDLTDLVAYLTRPRPAATP